MIKLVCSTEWVKWEMYEVFYYKNILGRPGRRWEIIVEI
jgi:hypothetical protein